MGARDTNDSPELKELDELRDDLLVALSDLLDKVLELRQCCVQKTAKLQILRESFKTNDWDRACIKNPVLRTWFHDDGVPK